jgi:GNAT superfamily N-acetyltransferase
MSEIQVRELDPEHGKASVEVLTDAFVTDPWMRWCFFADQPGYAERMRGYCEVGHAWHTGCSFPVLAAYDADRVVGVAYVMGPDPQIPPGDGHALLPRMRARCGDAAVERFARCNESTEPVTPETPAHCVALIGVRTTHQGVGVGRRLMDRVVRDAETDPRSHGVVLETSNPRNFAFYGRHGLEPVGQANLEGLDVHVLFRVCEGPNAGSRPAPKETTR